MNLTSFLQREKTRGSKAKGQEGRTPTRIAGNTISLNTPPRRPNKEDARSPNLILKEKNQSWKKPLFYMCVTPFWRRDLLRE